MQKSTQLKNVNSVRVKFKYGNKADVKEND